MTKWTAVPIVLALGLFAAEPAQAQMGFGVQGSWGSDSDFGLGVRVEAPIGHMITQDDRSILAALKLIAAADYFFFDCGGGFGGSEGYDCSWIEFNLNGAVPLPMEGFSPYAGAGLNIARFALNYDDPALEQFEYSNTEVGLNLLGGIQFPLGGMNSFAEGRVELGGGEQFVLTVGILF